MKRIWLDWLVNYEELPHQLLSILFFKKIFVD
jgi:hypothetical protein